MTKLEQRLAELDEQLGPLNLEREAVWQQILTERSPFKVGDVIAWGKFVGRVVEIVEWVSGEPMWKVRRIRKDGSEGGISRVYSFDKPVKFS